MIKVSIHLFLFITSYYIWFRLSLFKSVHDWAWFIWFEPYLLFPKCILIVCFGVKKFCNFPLFSVLLLSTGNRKLRERTKKALSFFIIFRRLSFTKNYLKSEGWPKKAVISVTPLISNQVTLQILISVAKFEAGK